MSLHNESHKTLDFLKRIGSYASNQGIKLFIVGGYVRDSLLKEKSTDFDLVVEGDAFEFIEEFSKHEPDGAIEIIEKHDQFKTLKIKVKDIDPIFEFASTRIEGYKEPAAFPTVSLIDSIELDLPRRDFTINALLISLSPDNFGEVVDKVDGLSDINNKLIRVFHDESFIDDPTRIYRAARFAAKCGFEIEPKTLKLMREASKDSRFPDWLKARKNRFKIELDLIGKLDEAKREKAMALLNELKALSN